MEKYELTVSLKFAAQMTRSGKRGSARGAIQHVLDAEVVPGTHAKALTDILVTLDTDSLEPKQGTDLAVQINEIADDVGGPAG